MPVGFGSSTGHVQSSHYANTELTSANTFTVIQAAALGPETEPLLEAALIPILEAVPLSPPEPLANTIVDENLPVTVSRLWQVVMQPDLEFAMQFHESRRNRDVVIGKWHTGGL